MHIFLIAVKGTALTWQKEVPMLQLNTKEDLKNWVVGSDKDIGGKKKYLVHFAYAHFLRLSLPPNFLITGNSEAKIEITSENVGRFYGNVCKDLPSTASEQAASGYAGMRSKV